MHDNSQVVQNKPESHPISKEMETLHSFLPARLHHPSHAARISNLDGAALLPFPGHSCSAPAPVLPHARTRPVEMAALTLRSAAAAMRVRTAALSVDLWRRRLVTSSPAETGAEERESGSGFEPSAAREYYDYRKSIYGDVTHRALLVDAVGTLVVPAQPTAQVSPAGELLTPLVPLLCISATRCVSDLTSGLIMPSGVSGCDCSWSDIPMGCVLTLLSDAAQLERQRVEC
jgi:hypothetical protein